MNVPGAMELAAFLACAAFLVGLINGALKLVDRMKGNPPAADVARESAEKFATKNEVKDHILQDLQEHSNIWSKIGGMERGLKQEIDAKVGELGRQLGEMERRIMTKDEERSVKVHDRLNELLKELGEIRGEMNARRE